MSALVVDSSAALSWCFEDEASPESDLLFERVRDRGAVVPGLWHLEVANVLLQTERRGRIATGDVATRLELIAQLPITEIWPLAERYFRYVRPRWEDRPAVWRRLLLSAQSKDIRRARAFSLYGIQLLTAELMSPVGRSRSPS